MSGKKISLRPGLRLVVDTHVLVQAARQHRAGEDGAEIVLLREVLSVCSVLVISPGLQRELHPRLGPFLPASSPIFDELETGQKLLRPTRSKLQELTTNERNALHARGHSDISDDAHLFAAARTNDKVVVTNDSHVLTQRDHLRATLGVEACSPDELLS